MDASNYSRQAAWAPLERLVRMPTRFGRDGSTGILDALAEKCHRRRSTWRAPDLAGTIDPQGRWTLTSDVPAGAARRHYHCAVF